MWPRRRGEARSPQRLPRARTADHDLDQNRHIQTVRMRGPIRWVNAMAGALSENTCRNGVWPRAAMVNTNGDRGEPTRHQARCNRFGEFASRATQ